METNSNKITLNIRFPSQNCNINTPIDKTIPLTIQNSLKHRFEQKQWNLKIAICKNSFKYSKRNSVFTK